MQTLKQGLGGLSLMADLNLDRIICFAGLAAALLAGAYIGAL